MNEDNAVVTIVVLVILAGAALMYAAMVNRRKIREMEHRERLALIERGIVPGPPPDPRNAAGPSPAATRYRTAGVVLIAFGLGLFFIIGFTAGSPGIGIGIGGAWAVVGAALIINYHLLAQLPADSRESSPWTAPQPKPPAEPPDNIAP